MGIVSILLPIFAIFLVGYIGQKKINFDTKSLSTMALYLMIPFLVFRTFYQTEFTFSYIYMFIYSVSLTLLLIIVISVISKLLGYTLQEKCGMILTTAFMNKGNYGMPLVLFAFGEAALEYAVFILVFHQLLMSTLGIYFAAKGSPNGDGVSSALRAVRRMPIVYAALMGVSFQYFNFSIPPYLMESVNFIADAAIPTIMIILGMQLAKIPFKNIHFQKLSISLTVKLFVAPLIAFCITLLLPVDPLLQKVMIILAATPSAANTTMYALQFDTEPDFVSSATLMSTILSVISIPIILMLL